MDKLEDYLRSLNPNEDEKTIFIYGSEYHLWRDGEYIGKATWTKDENIGDGFQKTVIDKETGEGLQQVLIADKWQLIIK